MDRVNDRDDLRAFLEDGIDAVLREGDRALEDLCDQRPEYAERLRERVATLRELGLLGDVRPPTHPERLGQYRLEELLGQGGMGAVYAAEHERLGRRVALKLIRNDQLCFPGAAARFRREIEAIAQLRVPGVVPILDVGESDGVPFYAMELLDGIDLARAITMLQKRRSSDFRSAIDHGSESDQPHADDSGLFDDSHERVAARIAMRLARTLARVHEHGIVHRDVKPSNVIVDRQGRVTLVDFGLAHLAGSSDLTRTGALLGSLPYMAPEQVRGDRGELGLRTDVYGIGITLHELVYLQPAFSHPDPITLSRRIVEGRPARHHGPRDLEIIIACATDPDPAKRYASADELADDLQRFIEFRPIRARRAGAVLRLLRWAQRHRARATAAIAAATLSIAIPTAIAIERTATASDLQAALHEATTQRANYLRTLEGALDALGDATTTLLETGEADAGDLDPARRENLAKTAAFYSSLRSFDADNDAIRRALVLARFREAELAEKLGQLQEALTLSEDVLTLTEDEEAARRLRHELHMIRANAFERLGDFAAAQREFRAAYETIEGIAEDTHEDRVRIGRCLLTVANGHSARRERDALPSATRAARHLRAVVRDFPDDSESRALWASATRLMAQEEQTNGNSERALELIDEARAGLEEGLARSPHDRALRIDLGRVQHVHGQQLRWMGRFAESIEPFRRAIEIRREIRVIWPTRPIYLNDLLTSEIALASSFARVSAFEEARELLEPAVELIDSVDLPLDADLRAEAYNELATTRRRLDGPSEATHALHLRAIAVLDRAVATDPARALSNRVQRGAALAMAAVSHLALGRPSDALEATNRAREDLRAYLAAKPNSPLTRTQLARIGEFGAHLAKGSGDRGLTEDFLREAASLGGVDREHIESYRDFLGTETTDAILAELTPN